jgi:hypothetical protein
VLPTTRAASAGHRTAPPTPGAPTAGIPARRDQTAGAEDVIDRDQQTTTVLYSLALRTLTGDQVVLSGRDRIVDGDETFEIVGPPELLYRRRRPHHWEARAVLIEG